MQSLLSSLDADVQPIGGMELYEEEIDHHLNLARSVKVGANEERGGVVGFSKGDFVLVYCGDGVRQGALECCGGDPLKLWVSHLRNVVY